MLDHEIASKERHDRFLQRVVEGREIWGLKSAAGWCVSPSTRDESEGRQVMPFWSDRAYAQQCAKDDWVAYEPTTISLDEFLHRWLPGMVRDGVLVGTNWNAHLVGMEMEPSKLSEELSLALRTKA
jgi:hypothetical protein